MLSTYKISYNVPQPIEISTDVEIPVNVKADSVGDEGYTTAKLEVEFISKPESSNPVITANEDLFAEDGSELQVDYNSASNMKINFDVQGDYSIKVKLIDKSNSNVIAEKEQTFSVLKSIKLDEAEKAVDAAEKSQSRSDYDSAKEKVDALDTSDDKQSLSDRLSTLLTAITEKEQYETQLNAAKQAVTDAETSKSQSDLETAKTLVNALHDEDKSDLLIRLDALQKEINNAEYQKLVDVAKETVEHLEQTLSLDMVEDARNAVSKLRDDDENKKSLTERIDRVVAYNNIRQEANDAIKVYEVTMQAFNEGDIDTFKVAYANLEAKRQEALDAINKLSDGEDKDRLTERYFVAENEQYSAYKMMLIGFVNNKEIQPVKIENVGGDKPYKVIFKGLLPGQATSAYLFYPEEYLRKQNDNILYPKDKPNDISSQIVSDSDNILISNNYIVGGQFVIIYEIANEWYQFVYEMDEAGQKLISVNTQSVSGIDELNDVWTVSKTALHDKIEDANTTIDGYEVGYETGKVTQEVHDTFKLAIDAANNIYTSEELYTIVEIENAIKTLTTAKTVFLASVNTSNKETLVQKINAANTLISNTSVGSNVGEIAQEFVDELQKVIEAANVVRNNPDAEQDAINEQVDLLTNAINKFNENIITNNDVAEAKMVAYETAAKEFFDQVIAKKKIN